MEVKRSGIIIKTGLYSGEVLHYPIVPERISHIQDLHISGLSDDCNIALTQGCRDLLDYMKDSELGTEGILVFSMDLKELDRYKASSSVSSVPFQSRTEKVVVIHNHPSDMLFSDTDLFRLYERDEIQILGAVGHNGSTYFAEKTDQYDAFGFWDFLEECKMDFPIKMSHEDRVKYVEKVMGGAEEYGVKFYTSIYKESN
ncbi:MAG: hypothetical protein IJ265_00395 [Oscillospiraceae bacterium]|nr:hypothetical protein [Oscillospiraceae bacterium]